MRYFTPELFIKLQECESPDDFRAVNAKWESAVEQYGKQLQELAPRLNTGLLQFVKRGSLHDARVLDIGTTEQTVTLVLQEELPPKLLFLTYSLVDAPLIDRNALPVEHRTPQPLWLYDELDVDRDMVFNGKLGIQEKVTDLSASGAGRREWKPIFLHSILLSNGWELRLRFHGLVGRRSASLLRCDAFSPQSQTSVSCPA